MCLNVSLSTISTCLNALIKLHDDLLKCNITNIKDNINITTYKYDSLNVNTTAVLTKLNASCSIICSINNEKYLNVAPDIVWLTPDTIGEEFNIYSNVVWKIE